MTYLRDHWRGRHALSRAFWINFLIPFVLIAMLEPWIRPAATGGSVTEGAVATLYILVAHAVILPWQIVGLWRSSRRHLRERGDLGIVTFAQAAALIALVAAAGATTTTIQSIFGFGQGKADSADIGPRYSLAIQTDHRAIVIDGRFDIGLSRDVKALLADRPDIDTVILNSDGGRVFEARGIAKQIVDGKLDTHVADYCRSACTIAFIAGRTRTLGEEGRLGFHSYRLDGVAPFTDPEDEQEKDKDFFLRQGVDKAFVTHAFATPHDDMWQPQAERLLRAGVVHDVLEAR